MCWSLEVSLGTSIFSLVVSIFFLQRWQLARFRFYGGCLLGVCSMQWAEAFLWYHGDLVESCRVGGANRFGTQILVPLALILQPLGPFFSARLFLPQRALPMCYAAPPLLWFGGLCFKYLFFGDRYPNAWLFCEVLCTHISPMGYLVWYARNSAPDQVFALRKFFEVTHTSFEAWQMVLWCAYISTPVLKAMRPLLKAVFACAWGLACCFLSMSITDSPPSNWCLYIVSYNIMALAEYALVKAGLVSGEESQESESEDESTEEFLKSWDET
ncbi:unnamed protein product [Effrenium voratum]|nr:unnamed protein product [Effrenium voratum]